MSWGRVEHPKKVFKVGDKLKVLIKEINGNKIALSLKFDDANPWKNAAEKYAVGNVVTGKVARMTDFGAFVELEPGVDALLHVSQIAKEHIEKPSDVLSVGDEVTAKVVDFNGADHKISLSVKALTAPEPAEAEEESDADADSTDSSVDCSADADSSDATETTTTSYDLDGEDIDETALSYAEIKALAAGNPDIIEKTELDTQVAKLKLLKQNYLSEKYELEDKVIKYYPNEIKRLENRIEDMKEDIEVFNNNNTPDNSFEKMNIKADGTAKNFQNSGLP